MFRPYILVIFTLLFNYRAAIQDVWWSFRVSGVGWGGKSSHTYCTTRWNIVVFHSMYSTVCVPLYVFHCLCSAVCVPLSVSHCLCPAVCVIHKNGLCCRFYRFSHLFPNATVNRGQGWVILDLPCPECCILSLASQSFFLLTLPMKMEQNVPKRRHIIFRRRGVTQKKEYSEQDCVFVPWLSCHIRQSLLFVSLFSINLNIFFYGAVSLPMTFLQLFLCSFSFKNRACETIYIYKGKVFPLQARCDPEVG